MPNLEELVPYAEPRRTAHQFARESLRRAILSGALPAGTRLVQSDLSARLRVSTTPVREALRDLTAEGLIVFDPHIGAVVRQLDRAEVGEIYEIRKLLEPLAIAKAIKQITDAELADADRLMAAMDDEANSADWTDLNREFHELISKAGRSPILEGMISNVSDRAAIYVAHSAKSSPERFRQGNREHRDLLDAIRSRNVARAQAILIDHLQHTLDAIVEQRWPDRAPADASS
jgi:DNA-binding GntR family transcriptional regulator